MHTLKIIKTDKETDITTIETKQFLSKYNGERRIAEEIWREEGSKYTLKIEKSWI